MTIEQQDKSFNEILNSMNLERRATTPAEILVLGTWTGEEFDDLTERLAVLGYAVKVQTQVPSSPWRLQQIADEGLEDDETVERDPELGILGPHLWDYTRLPKGHVVYIHLDPDGGYGTISAASPEDLTRRWPTVL